MSYVNDLFKTNFLEYASYVIKDRAIPDIVDGLKPVQRRILHSLFEMDDGKFNKVANVVGHCMKYHPHGDASIYSALVVLANKEMFIEKQGNFGNIYTGDPASAARYIECRLLPMAKEALYNPEITEYEPSYDGRNKEPIAFPAKIPVIIIQGAEGIAVGMSTKILPHNFVEVLKALHRSLDGEEVKLYPDFPTGGIVDVSSYNDGMGKVLIRAKVDTSDPKKILIKEIPYGSTTESLIASIEAAAKKDKLKISSINDYSTDSTEIEIKLARGVTSGDTLDALYAFTDCEMSVSVNLLLIDGKRPVTRTLTELIAYYSDRLKEILKSELIIEEGHIRAKIHAKLLEQIFIEEKIYKAIETMKTNKEIYSAITDGFAPYMSRLGQDVLESDVDRLLKIPIRRISMYDITKSSKELVELKKDLKVVLSHQSDITSYAKKYVRDLIEKYGDQYPRMTTISSFDKVDVRDAAAKSLNVMYDPVSGYIGSTVEGTPVVNASVYDRLLVIRDNGVYSTMEVPEKVFVGTGMAFGGLMDEASIKARVLSVVYKNKEGQAYLKRCRIEKYILNKEYELIPEGCSLMGITTEQNVDVVLSYKKKPRLKSLSDSFPVSAYLIKGNKAGGNRLSTKEVSSMKFKESKNVELD